MARLHGRQARALKTLARTRLLILDDWAMVKLTADQRRDLMEVIDDRHGRASTIDATQIPLERWHDQIGDPTYADAIRIAWSTTPTASSSRASRCAAQPRVSPLMMRLWIK